MRVSIFTVENRTSGKVLVFKGTTIEELLSSASDKLCPEEKGCLKRAFLVDGAEVTDVEEIREDDKLYFSRGGDFESKSNIEPEIKSATWMDTASSFWGTYSTLVGEKFPGMKFHIDTVEKAVVAAAPVVTATAVNAQAWVGGKVGQAVSTAQAQSAAFLASATGQAVNASFMNHFVKPAEVFYNVAVTQFQTLREQSTEKKVSLEAFLEGLKTSMGVNWNEKLLEPAKAFYNSTQAEFAKVSARSSEVVAGATAKTQAVVADATTKTQQVVAGATEFTSTQTAQAKAHAAAVYATVHKELGQQWDATVSAVIKSPVGEQVAVPATFFYQSALDSFNTLQAGAVDSKVSLDEYVGGVKIKLGGVWNDQFKAAANQLYAQFSAKVPGASPSETKKE